MEAFVSVQILHLNFPHFHFDKVLLPSSHFFFVYYNQKLSTVCLIYPFRCKNSSLSNVLCSKLSSNFNFARKKSRMFTWNAKYHSNQFNRYYQNNYTHISFIGKQLYKNILCTLHDCDCTKPAKLIQSVNTHMDKSNIRTLKLSVHLIFQQQF